MSSPTAAVLLGAQEPSVSLVPPAPLNEAPDAAALATSYGLRPDPWQMLVLEGWLGLGEDGRWTAPRCGLAVSRQSGKNGISEIRELFGMVFLAERILHTAHEVKTARKAFARLLEFFDNERQYPELHRLVREIRRTNGQEAILLTNGGSVEFISRSKSSGRGFSVDVLMMDEAQELSADANAALRPTIAASPNPQQILMGTPPGPSAVGEIFTRWRAAGHTGDDARLCWMEWSCAPGVDLDDPTNWARANPALGIRLSAETIADERSSMDDDTFARERLGVWPEDHGGPAGLDYTRWISLADPQAERGHPPAFAVATAPDHSWSAVAVAWKRSDGRSQVMLADYRRGTAWVPDRLAELRERWGGTASVDTASRGRVAGAQEPSQQEQAQAHNALADALESGRLRHGDEAALNLSVRAARWRPLGDSRVLDRKGSADISPLIAAALALHALTSRAPVEPWAFFE